MAQARAITVAIVGAGPRGTSVLERLLAHLAADGRGADGTSAGVSDAAADHGEGAVRSVEITMIDPFPAGPGHVWRTDQSRLYLMNTQSFYPTLVPDTGLEPGAYAGTSFEGWRSAKRESPDDTLTGAESDELASLARDGFPSRALYGRYLRCSFEQITARLPEGVTVRELRAEATAVTRAGEGFTVALAPGADGGPAALAADAVVLALGHVPSVLSASQRALADAAAEYSLSYLPPALPNDVDWDLIPADGTVLVRGLGLNFFDVLGQLTEGRGGRFEPTPGGFVYLPSGLEPRIIAASRRGVPYRAKAALDSYYPQSVRLRYLTMDAVRALAAAGRPGFDHDLWPLLHRDTVLAYYSTLVRVRPESTPEGFLRQLSVALDAGTGWEPAVRELERTLDPGDRLDLGLLARPLGGRHFANAAELDEAVLAYLEADALGSAAGEDDPVKMAIGALNAGRAVLKMAVADGGITEESWLGELRGWFEGYVEGLASGPPALRIAQLAAVVRAGVLGFTGPDPEFGIDPRQGLFVASSPWVGGEAWTARVLVEALAPANRVLANDSALLGQLLADGLARPKIMIAADGEPVATSGLDVTRPPYRPIGGDGAAVERLYVLGLQLSSVQWGNAIAAQAQSPYPSGYRTLADADAIARDILAPSPTKKPN
ncbi:MAG: FAD/NAD(P)-binding protein [Actinomycetales bacterium]